MLVEKYTDTITMVNSMKDSGEKQREIRKPS